MNHQCPCGFDFDPTLDIADRPYESFAVIRDKDYQKFLEAEVKVVGAKSFDEELGALGKASQYVTTWFQCPDCTRILIPCFTEDSRPNPRIFREEA